MRLLREVRPATYLTVLDRVLLDRHVSHHEADELVSVAEMFDISRDDAVRLHRVYLSSLAAVAIADGIVSEAEYEDLASVAQVLGLSTDAVDTAIEEARNARPSSGPKTGGFAVEPGDRIVFTGEARGISRPDLEYQAACLGYKVAGAVSGKTKLVVAADPDSLSGKARRARELGVPIVDFTTYAAMIG